MWGGWVGVGVGLGVCVCVLKVETDLLLSHAVEKIEELSEWKQAIYLLY